MKIRKQPGTLLLLAFSAFIIFGNLPRFISVDFFHNNFSITEASFYLISACCLFSFRREVKTLWMIPVLIGASTCYGVIVNGMDRTCAMYSCKLVAMLSSGWCLGLTLLRRFGSDTVSMANWFILIYLINTALGFVIFFLFPHATYFFSLMNEAGITYAGDPHSYRFISTYLDPNFYAAITCIPLLLLRHTHKKNFVFTLIFLVSILLSFSRSGIGTYLLLMGLILTQKIFQPLELKARPVLASFSLLGFGLFFFEATSNFCWRFFHVFEDLSAYARFKSFKLGWNYFTEYPLFGRGHHFLAKPLRENGELVDASILQTLADFGLIPTIGLFIAAIVFVLNSLEKAKNYPHYNLLKQFFYYLFVIVFFASWFNNIVYYQLWLIPMVAIFTYLNGLSRKEA